MGSPANPKDVVTSALDGRLVQFVVPIPAGEESEIDGGVVCDMISSAANKNFRLLGWGICDVETDLHGTTFFVDVSVDAGEDFRQILKREGLIE